MPSLEFRISGRLDDLFRLFAEVAVPYPLWPDHEIGNVRQPLALTAIGKHFKICRLIMLHRGSKQFGGHAFVLHPPATGVCRTLGQGTFVIRSRSLLLSSRGRAIGAPVAGSKNGLRL